MDPDKYQKELFEFKSPKKATARFGSIFTRSDFAIILTPEKMVFAAIGMIMLIVIFFALGVEKGRSVTRTKFTAKKTMARDLAATPVVSVTEAKAPTCVPKNGAATNITPKNGQPTEAAKTEVAFDKTKPYMVIAAAFSRKEFALKEVSRLKKADLEAFVYYGEPYYLACVGSFNSKSSAQKILNKVKQMHRDAYVRLR